MYNLADESLTTRGTVMNKKQIVWEHWNSKEVEDPIDKLIESHDDEDNEEESSYKDDSMNQFMPQFFDSNSTPIITPFGQYPSNSKLKPSDRWDCWIGNTNFTITEERALKIEKIEGIAALKILDRYSFCIGIAKLFDMRDVRLCIEDVLCEQQDPMDRQEVKDAIDEATTKIGDRKFWSIYVSNEGDVSWIAEDNITEEFLTALDFFEQTKAKYGGNILNSGE